MTRSRPRITWRGMRTRSVLSSRPALLVAFLTVVSAPVTAGAENVTVGPVSFDLPRGMSPAPAARAPFVASWMSSTEPMSIDVAVVTLADGDVDAAVREFRDWPGVGRTMVASFGEAFAKTLGQAFNASCSFTGVPIDRDVDRMAIRFSLDTTCATKPEPTSVRSFVVMVLARSGQIAIRVDARAAGLSSAESASAGIWRSLQVTPDHRLQLPDSRAAEATTTHADYARVSGGAGLRFTDYSRLRPAATIAKTVGALLAALGLGALLTAGLIRLGLRAAPSLLAAQLLLFFLATWGEEHDGIWEIDWLSRGLPALVAIVVLRGWAQRRWERRRLATGVDPALRGPRAGRPGGGGAPPA